MKKPEYKTSFRPWNLQALNAAKARSCEGGSSTVTTPTTPIAALNKNEPPSPLTPTHDQSKNDHWTSSTKSVSVKTGTTTGQLPQQQQQYVASVPPVSPKKSPSLTGQPSSSQGLLWSPNDTPWTTSTTVEATAATDSATSSPESWKSATDDLWNNNSSAAEAVPISKVDTATSSSSFSFNQSDSTMLPTPVKKQQAAEGVAASMWKSPSPPSRRGTMDSTASSGRWGAGVLVDDWSQFQAVMKTTSISEANPTPPESELSPSTSTDSVLVTPSLPPAPSSSSSSSSSSKPFVPVCDQASKSAPAAAQQKQQRHNIDSWASFSESLNTAAENVDWSNKSSLTDNSSSDNCLTSTDTGTSPSTLQPKEDERVTSDAPVATESTAATTSLNIESFNHNTSVDWSKSNVTDVNESNTSDDNAQTTIATESKEIATSQHTTPKPGSSSTTSVDQSKPETGAAISDVAAKAAEPTFDFSPAMWDEPSRPDSPTSSNNVSSLAAATTGGKPSSSNDDDDDDDDEEWITSTIPSQRYSREELLCINTALESEIGNTAAYRIDKQMHNPSARRDSNQGKQGIVLIRGVRQPPKDHSGGFSPGIPSATARATITVYSEL
ncbi:hypothetical protein BDB00DRAFT_879342 [Zychaea mexicana]|uniref:uncharacterized protein n=1 Tax=Zychaea mexicana TaxID=64656 RepID=UPI0022FE77DB|nr:uncharacterized protein BDB00DRAFT_879342 [Zychaea mexicana]KAI9479481.1 hypothetical protein BDB00DRAFT_879342 [Zychaea mexicana]